jgi:hypothetical protein
MFRDAKKDLAAQTVRVCRVSIVARCRKGCISPVCCEHPCKAPMVRLGYKCQRVVILGSQHRLSPKQTSRKNPGWNIQTGVFAFS